MQRTTPIQTAILPTQVSDAMITRPKVFGPSTTLAAAAAFFADEHVHALLIVDHGTLAAVVERADLPDHWAPSVPARLIGRLRGRTVAPDADLVETHEAMVARGQRRLAVVDERQRLLGLLCLKRSAGGFCSDSGVAARERERRDARR